MQLIPVKTRILQPPKDDLRLNSEPGSL